MPGAFSRLKVWGRERLRFSDLDAEFDNIISHMDPTGIGSDSATNAAMRADTNVAPYVAGTQTESLPTTLDGEFQGLRFALRRFFGSTYWYTDPGRTLTANPSDMAGSLSFDGVSAAEAFAECVRRGAIINALTLTAADFASSQLGSSNVKFGQFSFTLGAANILAVPGLAQRQGGFACHFRNLAAGDYIAYNPLSGLELYLDGSGFLTSKVRQAAASTEVLKVFSTVAGAVSRAANTSFQHVATTWDLAGGGGLDTLSLLLAGTSEGTQISGVNVPVNPGLGGVWFVGAKKNDPTWDHYSAMKVAPDAEAVDAWAVAGAGGSVASGVLTIAVLNTLYTKTNNVNLQNMMVETKFKTLNALTATGNVTVAEVSDVPNNRFVSLVASTDRLLIAFDNVTQYHVATLNTENWNSIRVTSSGTPNPTIKVYLNGVLVFSAVNATAFNGGSTYVTFGGAGGFSSYFEYYAYKGSAGPVIGPVTGSTSGQLDDVLLTKNTTPSNVITQLVNNAIKSVYGQDSRLGVSFPSELLINNSIVSTGTLTKSAIEIASDGMKTTNIKVAGRFSATAGGPFSVGLKQTMPSGTAATISSRTVTSTDEDVVINIRRVLPAGLNKFELVLTETGVGDTMTFNGSLVASNGDGQ